MTSLDNKSMATVSLWFVYLPLLKKVRYLLTCLWWYVVRVGSMAPMWEGLSFLGTQWHSQESMMRDLGLILMYLVILNVIFVTNGKCSISTLKIPFPLSQWGVLTLKTSPGYATGHT